MIHVIWFLWWFTEDPGGYWGHYFCVHNNTQSGIKIIIKLQIFFFDDNTSYRANNKSWRVVTVENLLHINCVYRSWELLHMQKKTSSPLWLCCLWMNGSDFPRDIVQQSLHNKDLYYREHFCFENAPVTLRWAFSFCLFLLTCHSELIIIWK